MANKRIEALEKLLAIKEETIKELEKHIQLLKNQPPVVITQPQIQPWSPNVPYNPTYPWYQPYQPYIVTSGGSGSVSITGDPLPLGSIQMGSITNDPNAVYTLTNSDGTSRTYTLYDIPRC